MGPTAVLDSFAGQLDSQSIGFLRSYKQKISVKFEMLLHKNKSWTEKDLAAEKNVEQKRAVILIEIFNFFPTNGSYKISSRKN